MRRPTSSLLSSVLVATSICLAMSAAMARPVAACVGGTSFDWAVTHAQGGILRAHVASAGMREDFTTDLVMSQLVILRGDPPDAPHLHTVAGAICDQVADAGETVLLLFDVRGGPYPYPLPLFYVVDGSDALSPGDVVGAFGAIPSTDAVPLQRSPTPNDDSAVLPLSIIAGLAGFGVALRRLRARGDHGRWPAPG